MCGSILLPGCQFYLECGEKFYKASNEVKNEVQVVMYRELKQCLLFGFSVCLQIMIREHNQVSAIFFPLSVCLFGYFFVCFTMYHHCVVTGVKGQSYV